MKRVEQTARVDVQLLEELDELAVVAVEAVATEQLAGQRARRLLVVETLQDLEVVLVDRVVRRFVAFDVVRLAEALHRNSAERREREGKKGGKVKGQGCPA